MNDDFKVLIVDDEQLSRESTVHLLLDAEYVAKPARNGFEALQCLENEPWDVVVTDLRMPSMDGISLLKEIKQQFPRTEVILMTAYGTAEAAVSAMRDGAADFLLKPFGFDELDVRLRQIRELREVRNALESLTTSYDRFCSRTRGLVGESPAFNKACELLMVFADRNAPLLITGETGTGKELFARASHQESSRSRRPFIAVACGAVPRELAESEYFGHEKGAFTNASQRHRGSFERANHGTLLLDDVDDLPLDIQVKLLRVLEDGTIRRVGGENEITVDVRVIATTKVDLGRLAKEKHFREDLLYRLRGLEIALPPLRERQDDILLLAHHFLHLVCDEERVAAKTFAPEALRLLMDHDWPGNARELRRAVEYSTAVCTGREIRPEHLPGSLATNHGNSKLYSLHLENSKAIAFNELLRRIEQDILHWALRRAGGEQQLAAELLDIPRSTFQAKWARANK